MRLRMPGFTFFGRDKVCGAGLKSPLQQNHRCHISRGSAMHAIRVYAMQSLGMIASAVFVLFTVYSGSAASQEIKVMLSGAQEIPPVTTTATGTGTLSLGADKSISGS